MTTWTLAELGCTGDCQQGQLPCTCKANTDTEENLYEQRYFKEPIPFFGWFNKEDADD